MSAKRAPGRPRVDEKLRQRTASIALNEEQLRHLDDVADASSKSRSEIVKWALARLWREEFPDDYNPFE